MSGEILDIREIVHLDDSIGSFEYTEVDSSASAVNLNSSNEITITITEQSTWICPSESYLIVEGAIYQNAANPVIWADAQGTAIAPINNALMFMLDNVKYYIGSQLVEYFQYAGLTTTVRNYLTLSRTYSEIE